MAVVRWLTVAFVLVASACSADSAPDGNLDVVGGTGGEASSAPPASGAGGNSVALDAGVADAGRVCFPCEDYRTCGGGLRIDLEPESDGCHLSGLHERHLLAPDGTVTKDGVVIGKAEGTGARVSVERLDGTLWLFCAAGGGCPR